VLLGTRLSIGELEPELREFNFHGREVFLKPSDLGILKGDIRLDRRRERGAHLCRQTRLLVHNEILALAGLSPYPS
jgi:hypothetical protein